MSSSEPSAMRTEISRVSRPLLIRLHRVPRPAFLLVWVALIAAAVLAPTVVALPAAVLVVIGTAWLTYLSWPVVPISGKLIRVLVLVLLVGATVARFTG